MDNLGFKPFHFFKTAAHPCSYVEGRVSRSEVVVYPNPLTNRDFSFLIRQGFRRSGHYVYRPACDTCWACVPVRIAVKEFIPNRNQKRVAKKYQTLRQEVLPCEFEAAHYELYLRYQSMRHTGGSMDQDDVGLYLDFLHSDVGEQILLEFRDEEGTLKMVSLIDLVNDGLSSVYTFFDTDNPRDSLGTFGILAQIELAKRLELPYVYLGFWIGQSEKMNYKKNFSGLECLENSSVPVWRKFKEVFADLV